MSSPLLSIIVPVYNAEKYLPACLDSLKNQKVKDCEFILVNDGSTDRSLKICIHYAQLDNRFKVFTKPNGGQASARNIALDNAKGKYIGFMDADDELLDANTYKYCITKLEVYSKIDIVQFPYYRITETNEQISSSYFGPDLLLTQKKDFFEKTDVVTDYCKQERKLSSGVWDKIFRREIFDDLRFANGRIFEDTLLSCDIFQKSTTILLIGNGGYGYFIRANSTTTSHRSVKAYRDQLDSQIRVLQFLIANGGDKEIVKTVYKKLVKFIVNCGVVAGPLSNYKQQIDSLFEVGLDVTACNKPYFLLLLQTNVLLRRIKQKLFAK